MLWNHKKLHTFQKCEYHLLRIEQLWNHTKLHTSQTDNLLPDYAKSLWNHTKLHTSQTPQSVQNRKCGLTTIQNYTPLKPACCAPMCGVSLTTIQNHTTLKPKYNM